MATLILIRHAEAEHHINGQTGGWTDSLLTDKGIKQTGLLAARLKRELGQCRCKIFSSDLRRARMTAETISEQLGTNIYVTSALRELNNGSAAGLTERMAAQIARPFPGNGMIDWQHYPGSESWRQFYERVAAFLKDITCNQNRPYLLVTHRGTILNIVIWWLGMFLPSSRALPISIYAAPASITVLKVNKWGEKTIERLNDTAHLYGSNMNDPIRF